MTTTPLFTFIFGLFLGLKHAFDPDHLMAVTTLLTEHKNTLRAALVGTFWGIGHTTTLFIVGMGVLLFRISIPQRLSLTFEFLVAFMLVVLGIRTIAGRYKPLHSHPHHHDSEVTHAHLHITHRHAHHRSFAIGAVHGLAGSGALMILVLSSISSLWGGLFYILLFGIGSVIGMTVMSVVMGLPFVISAKKFASYNHLEKYLRLAAGIGSLGFGLFMAYEIGFVERLFF